jgi:creatinine amidohydrolase
MVVPELKCGPHSYHHGNMPGTIHLDYDTQTAMPVGIIKGAAVAGDKRFVILPRRARFQLFSSRRLSG